MTKRRSKSARAATTRSLLFYHYTSRDWAASIVRDGLILPTVPNLSRPAPEEMLLRLATGGLVQNERGAPRVVWLTDSPSPGTGFEFGLTDEKRQVRFSIRVSARPWRSWANAQPQADRRWLRTLDQVGGSTGDRWFVHEGAISLDKVVRIHDCIEDVPFARLGNGADRVEEV